MATSKFINECKKEAYANRLGKVLVDNKEINEDNYLSSYEIDSACYVDGNIIGSIYVKHASISLLNNDYNFVNKTLTIQSGVKYDDGKTDYITIGDFIVEKPIDEKTSIFTEIEANDLLMNKINTPYVCGLNYDTPKTVKELYYDVCNNLGLEPYETSFTNDDILIENNPFTNNETNRTVLSSICKVSCTFVEIDELTNKIKLSWLSENIDYTFDENDYSILEGGDVTYLPINRLCIRTSMVDEENYTYPQETPLEEHLITIKEDYILYDVNKRRQAALGIWQKVNGLTYTELKLTSLTGKPFLKPGNKIKVISGENEYITYVLTNNFKYDGTFTTEITSPVLSNEEQEVKQNDSLGDKLRNTQIIVNKQQGQINAKVNQGDIIAELNLEIEDEKGVVRLTGNSVVIESDNFKLDKNGDMECNNAKLNGGQLVLEDSGEHDASITIMDRSGLNSKLTIDEDVSNKKLIVSIPKNFSLLTIPSNDIELISSTNETIYLIKNDEEYSYNIVRNPNTILANIKFIKSSNNYYNLDSLTIYEDLTFGNDETIIYINDNAITNLLKIESGYELTKMTQFSSTGFESDIYNTYSPLGYLYSEDDVLTVQEIITSHRTPTQEELDKYDVNLDGRINAYDLLVISKTLVVKCSIDSPAHLSINTSTTSDYNGTNNIMNLTDGYGNEIFRLGLDGLHLNGNKIRGQQKILWQGGNLMAGNETIYLDELVTDQDNGIVLIFSSFDNGYPQTYHISEFFIPKQEISYLNGTGHNFTMTTSDLNRVCTKYLYIYNDRIVGNDNNSRTGTGTSGIRFVNNMWCLREIIGV